MKRNYETERLIDFALTSKLFYILLSFCSFVAKISTVHVSVQEIVTLLRLANSVYRVKDQTMCFPSQVDVELSSETRVNCLEWVVEVEYH